MKNFSVFHHRDSFKKLEGICEISLGFKCFFVFSRIRSTFFLFLIFDNTFLFFLFEVLNGFANLLNLEKSHVDLTTHHVGYNVNRERDFMASVHHCRLRFHSFTDAEAIQNRLCKF